MNYQVNIVANHHPETLERILRVTRHRGFRVESLDMDPLFESKQIKLQMTVSSERPLILLSSQLEKLIDTVSVSALAVNSMHEHA